MLVELGVVEQRYQAVLEVLGGVSVIEVAGRYGVARQTVHDWLRRYASDGLAGLADRSSRPQTCPHQMPAEIEVRITELRRAHPGWGPRTIGYQLGKEGVSGPSSEEKTSLRLQTVGAGPGDGALADGCDGWGPSVRWERVEGVDRDR